MFKKKPSKKSDQVSATIWDEHGGFKANKDGEPGPSRPRSVMEPPSDTVKWSKKFKKVLKTSPAAFGALLDRVHLAADKDVDFAFSFGPAPPSPGPVNEDDDEDDDEDEDEDEHEEEEDPISNSRPASRLSNALERAISSSKSATSSISRSLTRSMSALFPDDEEPANALLEQSEATFREESEHMARWFDNAADEFDADHVLVALTTAELKRLEGKTVEGIEYLKNEYQMPPPSRAPSEDGDWEDEVDQYLTDNSTDSPHTNCKDLRKIFGPYPGFYIVGENANVSSFDLANNLSDYYNIPLIEPVPKWGSNHIKYDDDDDNLSTSSTAVSATSSDDAYELINMTFRAPRSQAPGQALIVYLMFHGTPMSKICEMLGTLDIDFMHKLESRWWKLDRIPEHSQLNDDIVMKVLQIAKARPRYWESERDIDGFHIMPAIQGFHTRMRNEELTLLAMKCLENYFA